MKKLIFIALLLISSNVFAQIQPQKAPDGIETKFIQLDTLTTALRDALTPKLGQLIYHKDTGISQHEKYNGTAWVAFGAGSALDLSADYTWTGLHDFNSDLSIGNYLFDWQDSGEQLHVSGGNIISFRGEHSSVNTIRPHLQIDANGVGVNSVDESTTNRAYFKTDLVDAQSYYYLPRIESATKRDTLLTKERGDALYGSPSFDLSADYTWTGVHDFESQLNIEGAGTARLNVLNTSNLHASALYADFMIFSRDAFNMTLQTPTLLGNHTLTFPAITKNETIATSVAGVSADASGNIDIPIGISSGVLTASRNLIPADPDLLSYSGATDITITVDTDANAGFTENKIYVFYATGTGNIIIDFSAVTVNGVSGSTAQTYTGAKSITIKRTGVDTWDVIDAPTKFSNGLIEATTGLEIKVNTFKLHINGADVSFAEETKTLPASDTFYIGYDLVDYSLHYLKRNYSDGIIWVGKVTTDATSVVDIQQITPKLPLDPLFEFKQKLLDKTYGTIKIAGFGDSLMQGAGTGTMWTDKLFETSASSFGYNIPNISKVTFDNYAVGAQTSHYGFLWTAKAVRGGTGNYNNTSISVDNVVQSESGDVANYKHLRNSPLFRKGYDLVIWGFGANGGSYNLAYEEAAIKKIREAGIPVVIITQNHRSDNATYLYSKGDDMKRIAEAYGCAYMDTWAFVKEQEQLGNTVFADVVHGTESHKNGYAIAGRTLINNVRLDAKNVQPVKYRFVKDDSQTLLSKKIPNSVEYDCFPSSNTGIITGTVSNDLYNPNVQYAGMDASASVYELTSGQTLKFSHAYASGYDVIIEGTSDGEFELFYQNGSVSRGVKTVTDTNSPPRLVEGVQVPVYTAISGNLIANSNMQLTCNSGTIRVYGILWHTYKNETLRLSSTTKIGTWATESFKYTHPISIYTDTVGDKLTFDYEGSGCAILLGSCTTSGIVDIYLNGKKVYADYDLYQGNSFLRTLYVSQNDSDEYDITDYSKNTVTIHLKSIGATATGNTPSATNRRLSVALIKQFDRR